jgi:iron(III) transport system ATP-binding protein
MGMSDRLALMRDGRIVQAGTPQDIYLRPESAFAADFMGRSNLVRGRVTGGGGTVDVDTPIGTIRCPGPAPGDDAVVVVRPQAIRLHGPGVGGQNCFAGTVERVSFLGDLVEGEVRVGQGLLKIVADPYRQIEPGQAVTVELPPERCVLVPAETP